jgi:uncharacterized tellurite resistance protein B-like protein
MGRKSLLEGIRFHPEARLIDDLFGRFHLDDFIRQFRDSGKLTSFRDHLLGGHLRLTPVLAPRLCSLLDEVRKTLGFREAIDLFVHQDPSINAFAIPSREPGLPHAVVFTSATVERMTDDELRFVMGHELAHVCFGHDRPRLALEAVGTDERGNSRMPVLLQKRLGCWDRLAELSADRAGLIAVRGNLSCVVSAFFKLASGLGPEHLRFDIRAFLDQLAELQKLKRRDLLHVYSHPATPIRVRALQIFLEAGGEAMSEKKRARVEKDVEELARLMDFEVSEPLDVQALNFLVSGGLLAAHADGGFSEIEYQILVNEILPLASDPEARIAEILDAAEAWKVMETSASWLRENSGEQRYLILQALANLVAGDGVLDEGEKEFMKKAGEDLGIPAQAVSEMLYATLTGHLKVGMSPGFKFLSKRRQPGAPAPGRKPR